MATKARHLKTPLQLWIADNRKSLGLEPRDIAKLTGVTEDTARGWESRGRPSEDRIAVLERRFGAPAPREQGSFDDQGIVAALREQADAIRKLAEAIAREREYRREWEQGFLAALLAVARPEQTEDRRGAPEREPLEAPRP